MLRELSLADRKAVVSFAEEHAERVSREGMKYIVEKVPAAEKRRLLALHSERSGSSERPTRR